MMVMKKVDFACDTVGRLAGVSRYECLNLGCSVAQSQYASDFPSRMISLTHSHDSVTLADYAFGTHNGNR
jgi:hypothetical protein